MAEQMSRRRAIRFVVATATRLATLEERVARLETHARDFTECTDALGGMCDALKNMITKGPLGRGWRGRWAWLLRGR